IIDKNEITNNKIIESDFRTTAISEGTKEILEKFGFWQKINKKSQPIKSIKVFDRTNNNNIDFFNHKKNIQLGYIVENKFLKRIFLDEIKKNKYLTLVEHSSIKNIEFTNDFVVINTQNDDFQTSLLIASDGKNSYLRKNLKQQFFSKQYNQSAIVINFSHSYSHSNTAYEMFYNSGPLATLPMLNDKNNYRSSLIWSHDPRFINSLYSLNNNFLSSVIEEHIKKVLGNVINIINKQKFS
ncbi:uncharacterized protein METZ01_LOCUS487394, partial [marine metagenome]